jgi:hypothetical protein
MWTLEQQAYWKQQGLWPIPGNFLTYVEDVFSTYLYIGNDATQVINNGIDLAGKGGLVWTKERVGPNNHLLFDTIRGPLNKLTSNNTAAQSSIADTLTSFNSTGFTLGPNPSYNGFPTTYCSWTFREQAKFFDVVTYTGNGVYANTVSHNLGSTPGMIIIKRTDSTAPWVVGHRGSSGTDYLSNTLRLNTTAAATTNGEFGSAWTSTTFQVVDNLGAGFADVNTPGATYIAYLFAHNAGGFGTSGTDNVISCGSYTGNGSATGPIVNLGYEPQYILIKGDITAGNWFIFDNMRGIPTGGSDQYLLANSANAEDNAIGNALDLTATGFQITSTSGQVNNSGTTYIYMAIRRPMKVPTDATTVFTPITTTRASTGNLDINASFVIDLCMLGLRGGGQGPYVGARLSGANTLTTSSTAAEIATTPLFNGNATQNNVRWISAAAASYITWNFSRRPGFFDVVCYTGTGSSNTLAHNLTVAPELIIIKSRSDAFSWQVGSNFTPTQFNYSNLEQTGAGANYSYSAGVVFSAQPTASSIFLNSSGGSNSSGATYVAYLFATVAGVSKVGSYTGTGAARTIDCGFTGGARFVLIKAISQSGAWYVWDTARGMVSGTDPSLQLNSIAAEQNFNNVFTAATGFQIVASPAFGINDSGQTYIFLAIA